MLASSFVCFVLFVCFCACLFALFCLGCVASFVVGCLCVAGFVFVLVGVACLLSIVR